MSQNGEVEVHICMFLSSFGFIACIVALLKGNLGCSSHVNSVKHMANLNKPVNLPPKMQSQQLTLHGIISIYPF